jgi:hypothetical protein
MRQWKGSNKIYKNKNKNSSLPGCCPGSAFVSILLQKRKKKAQINTHLCVWVLCNPQYNPIRMVSGAKFWRDLREAFKFQNAPVFPILWKSLCILVHHSKYCGPLQLRDPTAIMNSHILVWWKSLWSNSNFGLFIITVVLKTQFVHYYYDKEDN